MPTRCDVVRGYMQAWWNGECNESPPSPICQVNTVATARDMLFQAKYSPASLVGSAAVRDAEIRNIQGTVDLAATGITQELGEDAPTDVKFSQFTRCRWNTDGTPGGPWNTKYITRKDIVDNIGYEPRPIIGGDALYQKLPSGVTDRVPVWTDRILNPDLLVVFLVGVILLIYAVLLRKAAKNRSKSEQAYGPPRPGLREFKGGNPVDDVEADEIVPPE